MKSYGNCLVSDIESIETYGFRGEALSSLCNLSELSMTTRHETSEFGHKLDFNSDGSISSRVKISRNVGTTVTVQNVFYNYPVRCKDLKKNVKKEYAKLVSTLQAFAICFPAVKFSCTNEIDQKAKQMVLSTSGGAQTSLKSAIITVFGSKQWECLIPWQTHVIPDDQLCDYAIDDRLSANQLFSNVAFSGYVSSIAHGSGRSTGDRQLLFLNKRPCELPKFTKAINEVYKQFNSTQYPFICLFVTISSGYFDVNVTPDKRNIFLKSEKILIALLRHSALQMLRINAGNLTDQGDVGVMKSIRNGFSTQPSMKVNETMLNFFSPSQDTRRPFSQPLPAAKTGSGSRKDAIMAELSVFSFNSKENSNPNVISQESFSSPGRSLSVVSAKRSKQSITGPLPSQAFTMSFDDNFASFMPPSKTPRNEQNLNQLQDFLDEQEFVEEIIDSQEDFKQTTQFEDAENVSFSTPGFYDESEKVPFHLLKKEVSVSDNMFELFYASEVSESSLNNSDVLKGRNFVAKMEDKNAENELRRALSKSSFQQMTVIGQFNLGFIIARLNSDLFIIDQHASDEKCNFEKLENEYEIPVQPLISPITMEVTHQYHLLLHEHKDLFRKNGFLFEDKRDPDGVPGNQGSVRFVNITATPMSRNWSFGVPDVEEMLFLLQDFDTSNRKAIRPSRVRQMFASRACRKSIMIGQGLKLHEMLNILKNMSQLEQPWNCPHGRPTLRHLMDLNLYNIEPTWNFDNL